MESGPGRGGCGGQRSKYILTIPLSLDTNFFYQGIISLFRSKGPKQRPDISSTCSGSRHGLVTGMLLFNQEAEVPATRKTTSILGWPRQAEKNQMPGKTSPSRGAFLRPSLVGGRFKEKAILPRRHIAPSMLSSRQSYGCQRVLRGSSEGFYKANPIIQSYRRVE